MGNAPDSLSQTAGGLLIGLGCARGSEKAARICAARPQEVDLQATRFLNGGRLGPDMVVLYEEQLVLGRTSEAPPAYAAVSKVVEPRVQEETFLAYLAREGACAFDLYPMVDASAQSFLDNERALHFNEAADALGWARDLIAALSEHSVGAEVALTALVRSSAQPARHYRVRAVWTLTPEAQSRTHPEHGKEA